MIKRESKYIIRRIIIGVGISLVLMLIRSLPVHAATCDTETIIKGYYNGSSWTTFTSNPMTFSPSVEKVSIKFSNNNIQNKAIIKNTTSSIVLFGNHVENPTIEVRLRNSNTYQNITNSCTNNITHSCYTYNDNLCTATSYNIITSCNFNSIDNQANAIEIIYGSNQGITRFYNYNNCLQINPTDTQQIIESQNQNGQNIVDSINDNGEQIDEELNDIENAIQELYPNFGSCRRMGHVILTPNKALDSNGNEVNNNNYGISGMIRVYPTDTLDRMKPSADNVYACFYGNMNQLIECQTERQVINYQIPADAYYVRFTWSQIDDSPETYHCSKNDQMTQNAIDEAADSINKFREEYNNSQQICYYEDMNIAKEYYNNNTIILLNNASSQNNYIFDPGKYKIESLSGEATLYFRTGTSSGAISKGNSFPVEIESNENFNIWYWKSNTISQELFNSIKVYKYVCKNGNQGIYQYLSDTNVGNTGVGFFDNFTPGNMHGLGNIVALPLDFVSSLNNTCQPIEFPSIDMYSYHFQLTIPCLSSFVYDSLPSSLIDILRLLINGFIVYRILKWLFDFIIELRDPDYDELEVMDL